MKAVWAPAKRWFRGRARLGLVAALIVPVLAGCAPLAAPAAGTPPPGPSAPVAPGRSSGGAGPTPAAAPEWQTYTDTAAGYSISLPPGAVWRSGQNKDGTYTARIQFQIPDVAGSQGMVIRVEPNPGQKGLDQILTELYQATTQQQPPADLLMQTQALTVAGLNAVKLKGTGEDFIVVVPYAGKTYFIAPVHDLPMSVVAPQALNLFNQALATFAPAR